MSSLLKKIRGASKFTVTSQEKITEKISRSISDFSAHLYGARDWGYYTEDHSLSALFLARIPPPPLSQNPPLVTLQSGTRYKTFLMF